MTATQVDVAQVKRRLNLIELFGRFTGAPVRLRGNRATSRCANPAHQGQTGGTPPVSIDLDKQVWNCFGCGAGGDAIELVRIVGGVTVGEAIRASAALAGLPVEAWPFTPAPAPVVERKTVPTDVVRCLPERVAAQLRREYAASRRWDLATLDELGVAVRSIYGRRRLLVPVEPADVTLGWQARALEPTVEPRWLSCPGRASTLFGLADLHRALAEEQVLVVEGVSDFVTARCMRSSWMASREVPRATPFPLAVGVAGASSWRDGWADQLVGMAVFVLVDRDAAGVRLRAAIAADCERHGVTVVQVIDPLSEGEDLSAFHVRACDPSFPSSTARAVLVAMVEAAR